MKTDNLSTSAEIPAGLYGRLADGDTIAGYIAKARESGRAIEQDDEAGTVTARKGETVTFCAIRKGEKGAPWLLMLNPAFYPKPQSINGHTVTIRKGSDGIRYAFIDNARAVPCDLLPLTVGRDKWMREIVMKCTGCKTETRAGDTENGYCPKCIAEAEEENARLDAGE